MSNCDRCGLPIQPAHENYTGERTSEGTVFWHEEPIICVYRLRALLQRAEAERDALQQQVDGLVRGLEAVQALILESTGVYGLHPNGDGAPWDELRFGGRFEEWLVDFDAAIDAAMRAEG